MINVRNISEYLLSIAPLSMKRDSDNAGLLVGICENEVNTAIVALDITNDVIDEAEELGARLIVSHHPLFFDLKRISDDDAAGRKIIRLLSLGISAICMHTNLDAAPGGVNDALARTLGLEVTGILEGSSFTDDGREYGMGRIGLLKDPVNFDAFLKSAKTALKTNGLRYCDAGAVVSRVAVCGGSGGDMVALAVRNGCDTYVTSDIKYNQFLEAKELGINLIDGDHFCTENTVVPVLASLIQKGFPQLRVVISTRHSQIVQFT